MGVEAAVALALLLAAQNPAPMVTMTLRGNVDSLLQRIAARLENKNYQID